MLATALDVLGAVVAALVFGAVLLTVVAVLRGRPAQPPAARGHVDRVRGRNLRVWQASVLRDIRRQGRPPR